MPSRRSTEPKSPRARPAACRGRRRGSRCRAGTPTTSERGLRCGVRQVGLPAPGSHPRERSRGASGTVDAQGDKAVLDAFLSSPGKHAGIGAEEFFLAQRISTASFTSIQESGQVPVCKRTPGSTGTSTRAGKPGASQNGIRSTPSTTSKCASLLSTGRSCWRASAAIQTSLGGMGVPACFSSRRMLA